MHLLPKEGPGNEVLPVQARKASRRSGLDNVLDVLLGDSLRLARSAKSTWGPKSALRSPSSVHWSA